MNKKFKKIGALSFGVFLALGVAAAIASHKEVNESRAATPEAGTNYQLVTSNADLSAGSNYLIASGASGSVKVAGNETTKNNRPSVTASVSDSKISFTTSMLCLELGAYGTGSNWSFLTTNYETNGYLNATNTTGNNHLKVVSPIDSYAEFSISINSTSYEATITCVGKSSRNKLQFNSTANVFSCYTSGQSSVYLYREVSNKTPESLAISGTYQTTFERGDEFTHEGLIATVTYVGGEEKVITPVVTPPDMGTVGTPDVTVSYTENDVTVQTTYQITINPTKVLASATITGTATATFDGEWNLSALVVTGTSSGGTEGDMGNITEKCDLSSADATDIAGSRLITVKVVYKNVDTVYVENVSATVENVIKKSDVITVTTTGVSGTSYEEWDNKTLNSEAVYAGYTSNNSNKIQFKKNSDNVSSLYTTASGGKIKSIEVSSCSQNLDVFAKHTPYEASEDVFDTSKRGDLITSTLKTTKLTFTEDYEYFAICADSGATTVGSITVEWEKIPEDRNLDSIEVTTNPTKMTYMLGEEFDPTGMVVTAHYDNETSRAVTKYTVSPTLLDDSDITSVTISYTERGVTKNTTLNGLLVRYFDHIESIVSGIPSAIKQYATLNAADITLSVAYNTGDTVNVTATSVDLSTDVVGHAISGTVHYNTLNKPFTIDVLAVDSYEKVTGTYETGEFEDGLYVIGYQDYALANTPSDERVAASAATFISGYTIINDPVESIIWEIRKQSDGYYTLYNADANKYLASTASKSASLVAEATSDNARWAITVAAGVTSIVNKVELMDGTTVKNTLAYNSSGANRFFATYSASMTSAALTVYKQKNSDPAILLSTTVYNGFVNDQFTVTAKGKNLTGSIELDYDNETFEVVQNPTGTYNITILKAVNEGIIDFRDSADNTVHTQLYVTGQVVDNVKLDLDLTNVKRTFKQNEAFTYEGLVATVSRNNNTQFDVSSSAGLTVTIQGSDTSTIGEKTVLASYAEAGKTTVTKTYTINVVKYILALSITGPTKTEYYTGQTLDLTGLVVKAKYSDLDEFIDIPASEYQVSSPDMNVAATNVEVTVTSTEDATIHESFFINITQDEITGLELVADSYTTEYYAGQTYSFDGQLKAVYLSGKKETVTPTSAVIDPSDMSVLGAHTATVYYGSFSAEYAVTVLEDTVQDIFVTTTAVQKEFIVGETFNYTGLVVTATLASGGVRDLTESEYIVVAPDTSVVANNVEVVVKYEPVQTISDNYYVNVVPPYVDDHIEVTAPTKVSYAYGEELDLTGLVVKLVKSNGISTKEVILTSSEYSVTGFNSTVPGPQAITVTYLNTTLTASFNITIGQPAVTGIEITTLPTKVSYAYGEELDLTGLVVTATNQAGQTSTVAISDLQVSGYDKNTAGKQTVTVTYSEFDATFQVTVGQPAITGISVYNHPTKVYYTVGEALDLAGLIVKATRQDGSTVRIANTDLTITGFDSSTVGTKTIRVIYGNFQDTFTVVVTQAPTPVTLTKIEVTGLPSKVIYEIGEDLNLSGLVVTATYSNGETANITKDVKVSAVDLSSAGEKTVVVTYGNMRTTFKVQVKDAGKGCKGSVETTSIILSTLSILGVALLAFRKRKLVK